MDSATKMNMARQVKCSFCNQYPRPPAYSCLKGHKICRSCFIWVPKKCPELLNSPLNGPNDDALKVDIPDPCGYPILKTECPIARLFYEMGEFRCLNKGCRKKFNGPEMEKHSRECRLRLIYPCPNTDCDLEDYSEKWIAPHLTVAHNVPALVAGSDFHSLQWRFCGEPELFKNGSIKAPDCFVGATFKYAGNHFLLIFLELGKDALVWISMAEKEDKDFYFRIKILPKYKNDLPLIFKDKVPHCSVGLNLLRWDLLAKCIPDVQKYLTPTSEDSAYRKIEISVEIQDRKFGREKPVDYSQIPGFDPVLLEILMELELKPFFCKF